jgi:hypothetical protein
MNRYYLRKAPRAPFFSPQNMKKFLTILSISAALAACDVQPSAPLRMQASDLASPHVHHGTQSDFVRKDYANGLIELPSGIDFRRGSDHGYPRA